MPWWCRISSINSIAGVLRIFFLTGIDSEWISLFGVFWDPSKMEVDSKKKT